ncbi:MAG TPA: glycosyltransferase family 2 protein [Phycisphaerae bacterium]|nr:glycosyltransferase family 2 protein [Phycisphaerae bacterium]
MAQPLVSVIIPTCNRRASLEKCLDALSGQTYPNYEILVVDDGSRDDTIEFLKSFVARHPALPMRWFLNATNSGANHSRNRGVAESRGEILAFIDSDCVARADWIEQIVKPFDDPEVAAVVGRIDDPPVRNIFELTHRGGNRIPGEGDPGRLVGCNMAVRRGPMVQVGWDEDRRFQAMIDIGVPDTATSGGCDEEGIYLMLRAMGYKQRTAQGAVVLHEHYYTGRSLFRQAYVGGGSAAHLVYKYRLPMRIDVLPFVLAYATLLLPIINRHLWPVPSFFFIGACAALIYNDIWRKGKAVGQTLLTFPILLAYYHVRVLGYIVEAIRVRLRQTKMKRVQLSEVRRA